jgi:hypothetical protein
MKQIKAYYLRLFYSNQAIRILPTLKEPKLFEICKCGGVYYYHIGDWLHLKCSKEQIKNIAF